MNPEATMHLIQILEKTVSPDKDELQAAQNFLEQAAKTNLSEFIKTLSDILHHGGNSPVARMAAGLQLKNRLTSKDQNIRIEYQQRWLSLPEDTRAYIKNNILATLGTENNRPSSAAQCVAYVAVTELPSGQWGDLIHKLVSNIVEPNSSELLKESTLEAIGYICEEIDHDVLMSQSNEILTAIIHGMRSNERSNRVRLAATTALYNSLEFTRANFDKEAERNFIMEVVCETTQLKDTQVSVAALQCLVKIMSLYYQYMEPYMGQALFPITLEAMKSDVDDIALQGIEFWSNVSEEEVDLSIEETEALEAGHPPRQTSKFYAKGALQYLIPVLLSKLTKQEEVDDDDDWNPSKAASVCLMLLASCCEDDVLPHVIPFVRENITNPDWRYRDAALMAFGSILGGLENSILQPLVEQAMPTLIELMYDSSVVVRDSAAWTFGKICEMVPEAAINKTYLEQLLKAFENGLRQEPRVAANVCWAFTGLAEASYEQAAEHAENAAQIETYCLSPYFQYIIERLLETTDRPDAGQANLRAAAYEALMEMVKNSPQDCYIIVQRTTMIILERLNQVLQMENHVVSPNDRAEFNDLQGLLCATLQSVLRKVTKEDAPRISDPIMVALLQMFSSNSCKSGGVQEDAIMAVSTLVEVLGEGFVKYMESFKPFLLLGLKNHDEHRVCIAAIGLVGDICRALKSKVVEYCDEIMVLLLENLGNEKVHRSVKPQIFSVFSDIALGIGPEFKKYLDIVLQTLIQASQADVDRSDYDLVEYLNELREGVLSAYTGIVQGLKGEGATPSPDVNLLEPHLPLLVHFICKLAEDANKSDGVIGGCCGLIGDLCGIYGTALVSLIDKDCIGELLNQGRRSRVARTKTLASWATKEIRKLKSAASQASCWCLDGSAMTSVSVNNCYDDDDDHKDDLDLDDVPEIGEFGKYQKMLFWLVCVPACIPCSFSAFNQLFMSEVPGHWCRIPSLEFLAADMRKEIGIPLEGGSNGSYSKCSRFKVNWTEMLDGLDDISLKPNPSWPVEPCLDGWEYDNETVVSSVVIDFDLVCDRAIFPTLGLTALNIGGPIGVYWFGILNDRYGRKFSFFVCLGVLIAGGVMTALAPNFWLWSGSRFLVGLTVPAVYQIPFIISLELVGPKFRTFVTIFTSLAYSLGLMLLAGLAYLIPDWRVLAVSTSLPFVVFYVYWFFMSESPRWLLARGRFEEAYDILHKIARINGKSLPQALKMKLKLKYTNRSESEELRMERGTRLLALCASPNMRLKTILITLNWFANEMVYVGLSYYAPSLGDNEYLSFFLSSVVEIPSYLCCWTVMDRWGRRWPLSLCMVVSGVSCIITVLLPSDASVMVLVLYLISKFTISASFLIIYPFAGELYPTQVRGIGIGTSAYVGGLGVIIIPFVIYLGKGNLVLPLVIMGVVSVFGGLCCLRLPETLHQPLPQTVEEGEEFGKEWDIHECYTCMAEEIGKESSSYYDLSNIGGESEVVTRRGSLRRKTSKLVRQGSIIEANTNSSGVVQMTYWV